MPANVWAGTNGSPVLTYNIDSERRDIDVSKEIPLLVPDATPYLVVLMRARKNPVNSTEFTWFDEEPQAWYTQLSAAALVGDAQLSVDDASIFKPKDVVKNTRTGEIVRVTAVNTVANTITVNRAVTTEVIAGQPIGGTAAQAMNIDDNLLRIGNALEERAMPAESRAIQPLKQYNYIQSFSNTIEGSDDDLNEAKKTSMNERVRLRRQAMLQHRLDIERALLFGERNEDIVNNIRYTGGLFQFIQTNSYDVQAQNAGTLSEAEWENFCEMAFQYGSKRKLFVCSPRVGSIINQFASGKIITMSGEETYGLRLKNYTSFHGDVLVTTSQTFERDYQGMGVMIDVDNIDYRPYAGNDSKLRANIQTPGLHGWQDEFYTQVGLRVRLEKTHSILTGVSN